ncbi:hypothetical protein GCM10009720_14400 [Yaniella flava]|uniref:Uncharacterized protein n=1 Tax=Yaniella flava TaxID=287930 RepID=A0ABN2UDM4_9MICC
MQDRQNLIAFSVAELVSRLGRRGREATANRFWLGGSVHAGPADASQLSCLPGGHIGIHQQRVGVF